MEIVKQIRVFCIVLCALAAWTSTLALAQAPDPAGTAKKALDLFLAGKYAELNQMFAPSAKDLYPETALAKLGATVKAWGDLKSTGQPSVNGMGLVSVVTIPVQFEKQNIDFTFPVNANGQISQMYMRPGQIAWTRPDYVKPSAFQTKQVTVGTDEWKLPGTLTIPVDKRPTPAVVLVADVGPSDRDGSVFGMKPLRDLAEGLSSRGIAALRYEKRIRYYATKMREGSYTIDDETVHDALAAIALLRTQPEIDPKRIYVLGLGTGGFIAPRIAADDGHLAGLIILSAPARPLEDWFVEAAESLGVTGPKLDTVKAQATKVKRLDAGDADAPPLFELPAAYWLDLKGYDPVAQAKQLQIPALILGGDRDFQVVPAEFALWKSGLAAKRGDVLKDYPNLNHYFVAGEEKSSEAEYRKSNGHVAPEVIDDIVRFVNP